MSGKIRLHGIENHIAQNKQAEIKNQFSKQLK